MSQNYDGRMQMIVGHILKSDIYLYKIKLNYT